MYKKFLKVSDHSVEKIQHESTTLTVGKNPGFRVGKAYMLPASRTVQCQIAQTITNSFVGKIVPSAVYRHAVSNYGAKRHARSSKFSKLATGVT